MSKNTHKIKRPLTANNIFIGDQGLKLYVRNVEFGDERDETIEAQREFESTVLAWYAQILVELATDQLEADVREERGRAIVI